MSKQAISGKLGERTIDLFELCGVPIFRRKCPDIFKPPYVITQAPYMTCYNIPGKIDAKVFLKNKRVINIECKFQVTSGSVDEKFPYIFRCFEFAVDCTEFILLYDGEWWDSIRGKAAIGWAKEEARSFEHKFRKPVRVLNWDSFRSWLMKEFQLFHGG